MAKQLFTETFLVTVVSTQPIPEMTDHIAGRVWPMDHVTSVTAECVVANPLDILIRNEEGLVALTRINKN